MSDEAPKTDTLLFAVIVPGGHDANPDQVADELVAIINEERERNDGPEGRVMVSAIPGPQWMTRNTISRYRAADELLQAEGEG